MYDAQIRITQPLIRGKKIQLLQIHIKTADLFFTNYSSMLSFRVIIINHNTANPKIYIGPYITLFILYHLRCTG